ncbi:hypothetical protein NXW94_07865 [Bacteroides ovatus]|nr:hypothetical protein [Bacteroides ovatus]
MRTITLIYDGTFNTYRWLKAMMWARNEFHDLGYKIKYASIFDYVPYPKSTKVPYEGIKLKWDTIGRFDIVFLAFHHSQSLIGQNTEKKNSSRKILKTEMQIVVLARYSR